MAGSDFYDAKHYFVTEAELSDFPPKQKSESDQTQIPRASLGSFFRTFSRLSASDQIVVHSFHSIYEKLTENEKQTVATFLAAQDSTGNIQKSAKVGPGPEAGGFLMKVATQAIGGSLAKVASASFDTARSRVSEPIERAATGLGLLLVMAGIILHRKKPGLATILGKSGGLAIAIFGLLPHMAASLPPLMDWLSWLLNAAVIVATALLA